MKHLFVAVVLLAGCRTEIQPLVKADPTVRKVKLRDAECQVHDFPAATDVPPNSKGLGWVKVDRQETDDQTFELLRKKVCEIGGDAMSQMHWNRASGASVADPPVELEGNAWSMP